MIEMLLAVHEEVLTPKDKFILSKAHSSFPYCIYLRENGELKYFMFKNSALIDGSHPCHCIFDGLFHLRFSVVFKVDFVIQSIKWKLAVSYQFLELSWQNNFEVCLCLLVFINSFARFVPHLVFIKLIQGKLVFLFWIQYNFQSIGF